MTITPTDNDVLFGRGQAIMNHPGNARLRALVASRKPDFRATNAKAGKRAITRSIVAQIRENGGRFLVEDAAPGRREAGAWTEASEERACKKVMHGLREKKGNEGPGEERGEGKAASKGDAAGENDGAGKEGGGKKGKGGASARGGTQAPSAVPGAAGAVPLPSVKPATGVGSGGDALAGILAGLAGQQSLGSGRLSVGGAAPPGAGIGVSARSYIETGIGLLEANHWETQYPLSLSLFELSASVSFITGDTTTMYSRLQEVLAHVLTFEDSLKGASLLVKLLASNSDYDGAMENCLDILKHLGETFPREINASTVQSELPAMLTMLEGVTYERIKALPQMTDRNKLNAMRFLNMLSECCMEPKPLVVPLLASRMVSITLSHGFCEDSIVGLVSAGCSTFLFTDNTQLAFRMGNLGETLINESPQKHMLRARLWRPCSTLKTMSEPFAKVVALYPDLAQSALLAGNVDVAMSCRVGNCWGGLWAGENLKIVLGHTKQCMQDARKYQQVMTNYNAMCTYNVCSFLMGKSNDDEINTLTLEELHNIGESKGVFFLVWLSFIFQVMELFWMRQYEEIAELSERYSTKHPAAQQKRFMQAYRVFFEGISYLHLARNGQEAKYRTLGEDSLAKTVWYEELTCKANFQNKRMLLQAEMHYLNRDLVSADAAYEASIRSARENEFPSEEALAYELHGVFCVENGMRDKGTTQLRAAIDRYREWGAANVAKRVQIYVDGIDGAKSS
ncbi:hypothetical protein ACHAXT_002607 [Thalassiosira profunda]